MPDQKQLPKTEPELAIEPDEDEHGSGIAKTFHEIDQDAQDAVDGEAG